MSDDQPIEASEEPTDKHISFYTADESLDGLEIHQPGEGGKSADILCSECETKIRVRYPEGYLSSPSFYCDCDDITMWRIESDRNSPNEQGDGP